MKRHEVGVASMVALLAASTVSGDVGHGLDVFALGRACLICHAAGGGIATIEGRKAATLVRQLTAAIAEAAELADDSGWCPVDPLGFGSTRVPDVHVLGDAAVAGAMPKSAFSANS